MLVLAIVQACFEVFFIQVATTMIISEPDKVSSNIKMYFIALPFLNQIIIFLTITTVLASLKCYILIFMKNICVAASEDMVNLMNSKILSSSLAQFSTLDANVIITNYTNRLNQLSFGFIFPAVHGVIACIIIIFITLYTTILDTVAVLGILSVLFYFILSAFYTKKRRNIIGVRITNGMSEISEKVGNMMSFYREIKVNKMADDNQLSISHTNAKLRNAMGDLIILSFFPRYILEVVVVILCLIAFSLVMFLEIGNLNDLKAGFILFIGASLRLLPNVQTAYNSYNTLIANSHQLSTVMNSLPVDEQSESQFHNHLTSENMIELNNVTLLTHDRSRKILDSFSHNFSRSGLYVITGPSGVGKSTFIDALVGLSKFDHGSYATQPHICFAYSQQKSQIKNGTLLENISLYAKQPIQLDNLVADATEIGLINGGSGLKLKVSPENLSGGQIKKISLLRTLLIDADVLIFDEPTAGLDAESSKKVRSLLKKRSLRHTVICISHDKMLTDNSDEVIQL